MQKLANKTALITGGNSGIGFATAQEFITQGAKVIITGRNQQSVDKAVAQLGENASGIVSDSGDMQQVRNMRNQVKSITSGLDIIFINAGIGKFNSFEQMSEEMFDEMMNVNFKGAYFSLQQLLPLVNEGGSIILDASINAHMGMAGASVYAASKAALLSLTRNLAAELLPRKIRVNAVSPGPVETPFHSTEKLSLTEDQLQQMGETLTKEIPIGRFGTMKELAKIVTFFASDDSTFLLGAELIADGGMINL